MREVSQKMEEACVSANGEDASSIRVSVSPLADMLLKSWDSHPDKEALVFPSGRRSYDDVVQSVLHRARGLLGLGITQGDHVGILLPSGIDFVETLFAVSRSEEHTSELQSHS